MSEVIEVQVPDIETWLTVNEVVQRGEVKYTLKSGYKSGSRKMGQNTKEEGTVLDYFEKLTQIERYIMCVLSYV